MDRNDIQSLIKDGVIPGTWADLGSGAGTFTLALRGLAGPETEIYSVDINQTTLDEQRLEFEKLFPQTNIHYIKADFNETLTLPKLDGILMANSLHFIKYKDSFIDQLKNLLKPNGRLLIVEYDTDKANAYVPHPLSYGKLERLLKEKGFDVQLLTHAPSLYQNRMYSILAIL